MKLFVDDTRHAPKGWELARTITEAIRILYSTQVDVISLDHDIAYAYTGDSEGYGTVPNEDFSTVARFLVLLYPGDRPDTIYIHTANPDGAKKIQAILKEGGMNSAIIDVSQLYMEAYSK